MGEIFANPLTELAEYGDMKQDLMKGKGPVQICGVTDSQKVHVMYQVSEEKAWRLVVTHDDTRARELYDDFSYFEKNTWLYPARDLLFYSSDIHGNLLTRQRMQVFKHLMEDAGGTVVTTVDGLMDHLLPLSMMKERRILVESGEVLDIGDMKERLRDLGYERTGQVDGMGQFSIRGGIIDIFPLTEELPVRIELWGDEVDSIRSFDPESQRSITQMDSVLIYPAAELTLTKEQMENGTDRIEKEGKKQEKAFREAGKPEEAHRIKTAVGELCEALREGFDTHALDGYIRYFCKETVSFLEYMKEAAGTDRTDGALAGNGGSGERAGLAIFLDEPQRLSEKAGVVETEFRESMSHRLEKGYLLPGQTDLLFSAKAVLAAAQTPEAIFMTGLDQRLPGMTVKKKYSITGKNVNSYQNGFELLIKDLTRWKKEGYRVVLLSASRTRASRLAGDLREYDLRAFCPEDPSRPVSPGEILVTYGKLHKGFEYPLIKFVVITEGDMFGNERRQKKRKKYNYEGKKISSFSELSVGDYVVHESHGLGIYRGIEKIEQDHVIKDYIKVEYADGGNLYLPATRLDGIQKYAGADAKTPKLNKLGGAEWGKTKTRVRTAVREIAKELVELYAARQDAEGFVYGEDTVWQKEFEEMFPYEETDDQLSAIEDTKKDMESRKIMDRLICGDVGYGKTEIALRAAFKAVQEGKQVVYLVPTTILAQQHYNTFIQRMKDFPVRVDLMSRFKTPADIKKTLEGLKKGFVDIVIGTHRVLSKDVQFKDLGLLIIDEEQRFGVAQKERFKSVTKNVDVLTLSATPIPRTLNMALSGIRDMSSLEEAPQDRHPVQTYVLEYDQAVINDAVRRELRRGGQVYYLHNKVESIERVAARLQAQIPEAKVGFGHGKMPEGELSEVWRRVMEQEINVLVCTTIIETGVDVPNVNTIIIEDADHMGLSQLHQIRGRVGRSSRRAYAYLTFTRNKVLSEISQKRLAAIREFTEFGSGFKIAMRDLELRGAGNILGGEQHGHMETVGYDMYLRLLGEAVSEEKGEEASSYELECLVDVQVQAHIPEGYIESLSQRLEIYRRISDIRSQDDAMDVLDELIDRVGEPPASGKGLIDVALIRNTAASLGIYEIKQNAGALLLYQRKLDMEFVSRLIGVFKKRVLVNAGAKPYISVKLQAGDSPLETLRQVFQA